MSGREESIIYHKVIEIPVVRIVSKKYLECSVRGLDLHRILFEAVVQCWKGQNWIGVSVFVWCVTYFV